jgi:hypothetical protein
VSRASHSSNQGKGKTRKEVIHYQGSLDIAGTLLVIAQRFEKLESGLLDAFVHWRDGLSGTRTKREKVPRTLTC